MSCAPSRWGHEGGVDFPLAKSEEFLMMARKPWADLEEENRKAFALDELLSDKKGKKIRP